MKERKKEGKKEHRTIASCVGSTFLTRKAVSIDAVTGMLRELEACDGNQPTS